MINLVDLGPAGIAKCPRPRVHLAMYKIFHCPCGFSFGLSVLMTQAVERAIESFNRQHAPTVSAALLESHGDRFWIEFRGIPAEIEHAMPTFLRALMKRSLQLIEQERVVQDTGMRLIFQAVP